MSGRLIAIPDIHGRNDLLGELLHHVFTGVVIPGREDWAPFRPGVDRLIFLGDMIDRGLDSKGVIERVRAVAQMYPTTAVLRGNHEMFAVNVYRGPEHAREAERQCWFYPGNGGRETVASFQGRIPDDVIDWLAMLPTFVEHDRFFFSHAPVPRENRRLTYLRGQPFSEEELIWSYDADEFGFSRNFGSGMVGVCGHIHQLRRGCFTPRFYPHYLFLDAGCGCHEKAPLIACDVESRRYLEVTARDGQYRMRVMNQAHEEVRSDGDRRAD